MTERESVKVWDTPTRLFHWFIVILIVISWRSAENGAMDWHYISGLTAFGLLLFRLIWGLIGGSTARFSQFLHSPWTALRYLRSPTPRRVLPGHNPLGGYSVIAMLFALAVQIGTGLIAVDVDGIESGPLSYLVSFDQGRAAAEIHEISFNVLAGLIGLHLLAIVYYRVRLGRRLVLPMVTGRDPQLPADMEHMRSAGPLRFILAVGVAASVTWWVSKGLIF